MSVVLTSAEINLLWSTRTAQQDYVYVCEDGFLYKGLKDGTLQRVPNTNLDQWTRQKNANQSLPYRNKTIEQGTSVTDGAITDIKTNSSGNPITETTITSSVLPSGAATETKQDTGNTSLSNIDTNLGAKSNDVASSDTGTFSLIALFKRLLQKLTSSNTYLSSIDNKTYTNKISEVNSTSTPLNSGATFTGTAEDVGVFNSLVFSCKSDQHGTLYAEFSSDGTNWDSSLAFEIYAGINEVHRLTISKKYFRIRLTNDSASNQTYLRLQTLYGSHSALTSALNSTIYDDSDATTVRPLDFNLMVAEGLYYDRINTIKDGYTPSISSGAATQDLWTNSGVYTGFVTATAAAELVVAGADTGTVYYSYMATDTDLDYTFGSKAITGAGTYSLGHNIWRCNFMYFVASTNVFNSGLMTIRHTATPANIFCTILAGYSQSFCAAYTVPYNSSVYIDRWQGAVRGGSSGSLDGMIYYKAYGESPRYRFPFELQFGSLYFDDVDYLIKIPSRTDFIPRILNSSANNLVGKFSYRLIKVK